ncbi:hypothetical protein [Pararhodobacter zhoushanensis]|uniref:Uncharacterized protein n=1 Tax=Pararhodobacter zhoushanensis TaxID=2479545 RepID=A0ABT3H421_9RHOB|nr:hypothetical protein [Pararhodobacter zhoushanensis]MCW1934549.1 hypothetical protein [Pararhodobacter zhoushanensis]
MDAEAQKAGEKRVKDCLIDPLVGLGLLRPAGMKVDQFDAMREELARKLAYMTAANLAALAEQITSRPQGKGSDRWPAGPLVLQWGIAIQAPPDDASPLLRAIFAHATGQEAIAAGYAPELLVWAKKNRSFPKSFMVSTIRKDADNAMRRAAELERIERDGEALSAEETAWLERRRAATEKCRKIGALSLETAHED